MFEIIVGFATIVGTIFAIVSYLHSRKSKLSKNKQITTSDIKILRTSENIPKSLNRIVTGKEVMNIVENACTYQFDYDEPEKEHIELIGNFLDKLKHWGDMANDLSIASKINLTKELSDDIKNIENAGYFVFGAREKQTLKTNNQKTDWSMAIIRVLKSNNSTIVKIKEGATNQ